jgi:hypothetical protein
VPNLQPLSKRDDTLRRKLLLLLLLEQMIVLTKRTMPLNPQQNHSEPHLPVLGHTMAILTILSLAIEALHPQLQNVVPQALRKLLLPRNQVKRLSLR